MTSTRKIFYSYKLMPFIGIFFLAAFILMAGCAGPSRPVRVTTPKQSHPPVAKESTADTNMEKRLRREYKRWQGTEHRLGGSGHRGIDCSGFVKAIYKDVFNIYLPRTTKAQVRQGRAVSYENLRAGDLVFFRPPSYPRHVGIYLGGSEFVHASKNKGVTVSRIDQVYWGKYYWTARRILPKSYQP